MKSAIRRLLSYPFSKKKRVRELSDAKISLEAGQQHASVDIVAGQQQSYSELKFSLSNIGWQTMSFDRLCALPASTIQAIEMQIKKDKFNVADSEFYEFGSSNFGQEPSLNRYYRRYLALITNDHSTYDQLQVRHDSGTKYLAEMYVYDLAKDQKLMTLITYFINNLTFPNKLEALAEPTLVKCLLAFKRELMIQGVTFQSQQQRKAARKAQHKLVISSKASNQNELSASSELNQNSIFDYQERQELQPEEESELLDAQTGFYEQATSMGARLYSIVQEARTYANQIKILRVIGYEYQFWVDVKHNRAKNGQPDDYIIEERVIDNPNQTLLITSQHPSIKVKYIVHKRKRKEYNMQFCTKAELQVLVNGHHRRNVKIEWMGPSTNQTQEPSDFRIIDYEGLMRGNPTIKSVFQF